jgi:hypothetical protein
MSDVVGRGQPPMTAHKEPFLSGATGLFNYTKEMGMVASHDRDPRLLYTT